MPICQRTIEIPTSFVTIRSHNRRKYKRDIPRESSEMPAQLIKLEIVDIRRPISVTIKLSRKSTYACVKTHVKTKIDEWK